MEEHDILETEKQKENSDPRPWLFKKGQSGNPAGRPKGKTLKEYCRDFIACMSDDERQDFLNGLDKETIWKMAEGNPKQDTDVTSGGEKLQPILVKFIDGNDRDTNRV